MQNTLDFLSSCVLYVIYLVLSEATVKGEERHQSGNYLFKGAIIMLVLGILFFIPELLSLSTVSSGHALLRFCVSLMLSIFSAVTFTLILGKLNSSYLQFPSWMISGLYVYAVVQAYKPISELAIVYKDMLFVSWILQIVQNFLPWITLAGKMLLMLALIWISDRKRFVFYLIHQSLSLTDAPRMLKRFDQHLY